MHDPRRRDRDRGGRERRAQLHPRASCPTARLFSLAENLIEVRLQLIDASGKTYDPNVPNDDLGIGAGLGASEFAGPRFSPDGKWLFVNIQVPGITFAITGPWAWLGL